MDRGRREEGGQPVTNNGVLITISCYLVFTIHCKMLHYCFI